MNKFKNYCKAAKSLANQAVSGTYKSAKSTYNKYVDQKSEYITIM